ncbi:MAG: uroporphyrinogen decarboxylase [Candidatus Omnitrophica bacterium]|nr:uroporphyrinogen decarboxylase [Candidatus Omnitrophota bacterium]
MQDIFRNSVFLKACRREPTEVTPVWLMRQAGRYMKEYRALRDKTPFIELCRNKDLVTEITVKAQEKIKADAAIIFSDILLVVEALGLGVEYGRGEGPLIRKVIRAPKDVERLREVDPKESLSYVLDAVRQTRASLSPRVPLIGFAGAPFTLSSYMIEGGASKDFKRTKNFMIRQGGSWAKLMRKLVRVTISYLRAQIEAGAQAVQLFDSWVGCLTAEEYETYVLPYSREAIKGAAGRAPVIHFGTGTARFLEAFGSAGGEVVSVDHRAALGEAWKKIGYSKAIQGNLDPRVLCGPLSGVRSHVKRILKEAGGRPGHIFNLGHGVLPETPVQNVIALVEMVHEWGGRQDGFR